MKSKASARWEGSLKGGKGYLNSENALDNVPYTFLTRFEKKGANPEELLAAAHAGCFSMALSMILGEAGFDPESISTEVEITLEKTGEGFAITGSHLNVTARITGASDEEFRNAAEKAKDNCPVSKLFNTQITMEARLE